MLSPEGKEIERLFSYDIIFFVNFSSDAVVLTDLLLAVPPSQPGALAEAPPREPCRGTLSKWGMTKTVVSN